MTNKITNLFRTEMLTNNNNNKMRKKNKEKQRMKKSQQREEIASPFSIEQFISGSIYMTRERKSESNKEKV